MTQDPSINHISVNDFDSLRAQIRSSELESSYRFEHLEEQRRWTQIVCSTIAILALVFAFSDWAFFGNTLLFYIHSTVRAVIVIFALSIIFFAEKLSTVKKMDTVFTIFGLVAVSSVLFINAFRPPDYLLHLVLDLSTIFMIYALYPFRFTFQLFFATVFSLGCIAILLLLKDPLTPVENTVIFVGFIFTNGVGIIISRHRHFTRRLQHLLRLREEGRTQQAILAAQHHETGLTGMVNICSCCKRIRDDDGSRIQIEEYVEQRTEARFSHGLCKDCLEDFYPEWVEG